MWPFDQNNQQAYQQYAQAYDTGNYGGFNHNQLWEHLFQFLRGAPPEMQQQIYQQHFAQMPYEQRMTLAQQVPPQYAMNPDDPWSMAQGFMRMGQEQPHLLRQIFSHPVLMGGAAILVGLIAKHMLSQHHNQYSGSGQPYAGQQYAGQPYNGQQYVGQPYSGQQYGGQPDGYGQQYGYNQGMPNQQQYLEQELYQERQREQELRRELQDEERRFEGGEHHHHHHHHHREREY